MSYQIFQLPPQHPLSAAGRVLPGAKAYFYLTGTSTPADTYSDEDLQTEHENPVEADTGGRFPTIYLDPDVTYKVTITDANDVLLYTVDPANPDTLQQELASTTQGSDGSRLVGYRSNSVGSVGRSLHSKLSETLSITDFGADPSGVESSQDALDAIHAVAAASSKKVKILFPPGTYKYTTSPNWAINHLSLQADGEVVLDFVGTGNAVIFDGGSNLGDNVFNCRMEGNFRIHGTATATNGLFVRGVHHSKFEARVRNVSEAGCDINFCVGSEFRVKTTVASGGAFSTTPVNGYLIKGRDAGEYTAWCQFYNTVIDSCSGFGIDIVYASGCAFHGGFSEFNYGGVRIRDTNLCQHNSFYSFDCESNTDYDFLIYGQHNHLYGCTNFSNAANNNVIIGATAVGTHILGGYHKIATVESGSEDSFFLNCSFSNTASGITGSGKYRSIGCYFINPSGAARTAAFTDVYGDSGTFTPTIIGSSTAGTQTYTAQVGHYRKIGDIVQFQLYVAISAKGGSMAGNVLVGGLPFTLKNTSNLFGSFAVSDYNGITNAAGRTQIMARGGPGTSLISIIEAGSGVASQVVPVSNLAATAGIAISGTYRTD